MYRTRYGRRGSAVECGPSSLLSHSPRSCKVISFCYRFTSQLSIQCAPCILDLAPFIASFPVDFYLMACGLLCLLLLATVKPIMGP